MERAAGLARTAAPALAAASLVGMAIGIVALPAADAVFLAGWLAYPVVGAVILVRQPGHHVGWFTLGVGAGWGLAGASVGAIQVSGPGADAWWGLLQQLGFMIEEVCLGLVIVLFPHPATTTKGQRMLVGALLVLAGLYGSAVLLSPAVQDVSGTTSPFGVEALADVTGTVMAFGSIGFPVLLVAGMILVGVRYGRSAGIERLQYRWFAAGVAVMVTAFVGSGFVDVWGPVMVLAMSAPPVAIGIAIVRYRLYEIDRLISRTTTYAVVSGLVICVYALVVTAVTRLVPDADALAVAGATLAAAAVFRPLLRAVQDRVDRRFNRERYDAALEVDGFAARLRDLVDPEAATEDLVRVVGRTVAPAALGAWVAGPS